MSDEIVSDADWSSSIKKQPPTVIERATARWRNVTGTPTLLDYYDIGTILTGRAERRSYGDDEMHKVARALQPLGNAPKRSSLYKAAKFSQCCTRSQADRLFKNGVSWRTVLTLCDPRVDQDRTRIIGLLALGQQQQARKRLQSLVSQNKKVDQKTLNAAVSKAQEGISRLKELATSAPPELAAGAREALKALKRSIK